MEATRTQPGYRKQKRQGRPASAFVEVKGVRRHLGRYGTPESYQRYAAFIAEWESSGHLPLTNTADLRVVELVDHYWSFAELHYRKANGTPTSELDLIKRAAAILLELYGDLPAKDFSPRKLVAVRTTMVNKGWCRKVANGMTGRVKRIFKWATADELIPPNGQPRPASRHRLEAGTLRGPRDRSYPAGARASDCAGTGSSSTARRCNDPPSTSDRCPPR